MLSRIDQLVQSFEEGIDGFVVPSVDEFQSEFCPDHSKRLQWLTGFTGSNGIAIILKDKKAFFTDGRYILQSKNEIDQDFQKYNLYNKTPYQWLSENLKDLNIYLDSWLLDRNVKKCHVRRQAL